MAIVLKKIEARGFDRDCVAIWIGWRKISKENRVACQSRCISSLLLILSFICDWVNS